jgi:hypothetical protein
MIGCLLLTRASLAVIEAFRNYGSDSTHPISQEQIMVNDPESKEAQEQGRRDTEGRPVIRSVDEKKKEDDEAKEKPVDPE